MRSDEAHGYRIIELETRGSPGQPEDMTMFRDGFQTGKFMTLGPSEVEFNSGEPGINYVWWVLTLTGDGWVPSDTARLPWPTCPVDCRAPGDMD